MFRGKLRVADVGANGMRASWFYLMFVKSVVIRVIWFKHKWKVSSILLEKEGREGRNCWTAAIYYFRKDYIIRKEWGIKIYWKWNKKNFTFSVRKFIYIMLCHIMTRSWKWGTRIICSGGCDLERPLFNPSYNTLPSSIILVPLAPNHFIPIRFITLILLVVMSVYSLRWLCMIYVYSVTFSQFPSM